MTDVGLFDKIIGVLMKRVGTNVIGVCVMTCIIAMIGHLDGGGASTFLITIPAMLPIFKKLHMRRTTLLLICVTAMGVMNLMPWGGPTMRAASVLEVDANLVWKDLLPIQIVGILIAFVTAFIWGNIEKKRGAGIQPTGAAAAMTDDGVLEEESTSAEDKNELARPKLFAFNVCLTLVVILQKIGFLDLKGGKTLSRLVVNVFLPCETVVAFTITMNKSILSQCLHVLIISILLQILCLLIGHLAYRKEEKARRTVLEYGTLCSNAGVLGNAIADGLYGSTGLLYASIFLIPLRIMMWSVGVSYFTKSDRPSKVWKKVLTHPCIVVLEVGLILMITQIRLRWIMQSSEILLWWMELVMQIRRWSAE